MWEKYSSYSNSDLISLIDSLPNLSLESSVSVKEIKIQNYSINIFYGNNTLSQPWLNMKSISMYTDIGFECYKIVNEIKEVFSISCIANEHNKDNLSSFDENKRREIYYLLNSVSLSSSSRCVTDKSLKLEKLFDIIRFLSKYCKLLTFS